MEDTEGVVIEIFRVGNTFIGKQYTKKKGPASTSGWGLSD